MASAVRRERNGASDSAGPFTEGTLLTERAGRRALRVRPAGQSRRGHGRPVDRFEATSGGVPTCDTPAVGDCSEGDPQPPTLLAGSIRGPAPVAPLDRARGLVIPSN